MLALETQSFGSDFEFQEAMRSIFRDLHDAHTNYYAPVPQAAFTFALPFAVFAYAGTSNDTVLEISDELFHPDQWPEFNASDFVGARVVQIDNVPALDYVKDFALNNIGLAKDPAVRFNLALLQRPPLNAYNSTGLWKGMLTFRPHHFALTPENGAMLFDVVLANGTSVKQSVSWRAMPSRTFSSTQDYVNSYFNGGGVRNKSKKTAASRQSPVPLFNSTKDGVGFYLIDQGRTLVWYQNNFEPADYFEYFQVVFTSISKALWMGASRLIMDFSLNGGGDICLGRSMLKMLFS